MNKLQESLLNKYHSEYMQRMINKSPIFNYTTTQIYEYANNMYVSEGYSKEKALMEGRIGEIVFGEHKFFGSVFKFNADVNLYTLTRNVPDFNYGKIDFSSRFGVDVDVKMIGPTSMRFAVLSNGTELVREIAFNESEIQRYLNESVCPFLLIFSDNPFFEIEYPDKPSHPIHHMFVDIRKAYNYKILCDTMDKFEMCGHSGRHMTYRLNVEYFGKANQFAHYLFTAKEFFNFIRGRYIKYDNGLANTYDNLARIAGLMK